MIGAIIASVMKSAITTIHTAQYSHNMKILHQQANSRMGGNTRWKTLCECQFQDEPLEEECEDCAGTGKLPIPVEEVIQNEK